MEKNTNKKQSPSTKKLIVLAVALLILSIAGVKMLVIDAYINSYKTQVIQNLQKETIKHTAEEAALFSSVIVNFPTKEYPLFENKAQLQTYVQSLSKGFKRSIVVLDSNKKILASGISAEVGSVYQKDPLHEVEQTLKDGKPRGFVEKKDKVTGALVVVLAVKNSSGIKGAVIFSTSHAN